MKNRKIIAGCVFACILTTNVFAADRNDEPMTQTALIEIAQVHWQLADVRDNATQHALANQALPQQPPVTIVLQENGKVAGGATVNRYFGEFTLSDKGVIQWQGPGFGATMMAGPQELMEWEQYYFQILHQCDRLSLKNERLIFHTQDGKLRVEYKKQ